ncbi:MAG: TlyA family RNA methyltransferase [Synechococcales bacterium]|nr:TlyA family RNA methyltransferase [Synechococcales bacterium]
MAKQRLDILLVERQLCGSRQQAQRLIQAGEVKVNQSIVDKPGVEVELTAQIVVRTRPPFVSRGGEKLAKAIALFNISVKQRICLDGGISTGGFTDCLLQSGAQRVYGIDVGYGQVDWKLRQDHRVILRERTNIRYLTPSDLYGLESGSELTDAPYHSFPDLGVVDVSFISLTKIMSPLWHLLRPPREVVLLVKPQFEVGRAKVGKKGVVRDPVDQAEAILTILQCALAVGWQYCGLTWSPLTGPQGNIEYLLWLGIENPSPSPNLDTIIQLTHTARHHLG